MGLDSTNAAHRKVNPGESGGTRTSPQKGCYLLALAIKLYPPSLACLFKFKFYGRVLDLHFCSGLVGIVNGASNIELHSNIDCQSHVESMLSTDKVVAPFSGRCFAIAFPARTNRRNAHGVYVEHGDIGPYSPARVRIYYSRSHPARIQMLVGTTSSSSEWCNIDNAGKFFIIVFRVRILEKLIQQLSI